MSDNYNNGEQDNLSASGELTAEPRWEEPAVAIDGDDEDDAAVEGAAIGRTAKRANSVDRAMVRRVAAKYEELTNAGDEHLELLSTALGVPNTTIDLTVAVITGRRGGLAGLTDTLTLSQLTDPYEGIIAGIALGRARIKGVWAVLSEMGAVSGQISSADVRAGGAVARAAAGLDEVSKAEIATVLALAKK